MKKSFILVMTICLVLSALMVLKNTQAQTRSSSNYQIQQDSINMGGTEEATSSNYQVSDTLGEIGTGISTSSSYNLYAGYRQMDISYIAISGIEAVSLSPNIGGVSGGTANGSTTINVTTDSSAGYTATIQSDTNPALKSGASNFSDYSTTGDPEYSWSVVATSSAFGYTPEGNDIPQKFLDDGVSACNQSGGSDTSNKCWYGLKTSEENVAKSTSSNHPSGTQTTLKFRAESGSSHIQEAGDYSSIITVTATTN